MYGKLIYLASPYTHEDEMVRQDRYDKVTHSTYLFMTEFGHQIFSPITYGWPIAKIGDLPTDWEYWEECCKVYVSRCQELWVLMLPGWEESTGVTAEIKYAKELGIPVNYVEWRFNIVYTEKQAKEMGYVR